MPGRISFRTMGVAFSESPRDLGEKNREKTTAPANKTMQARSASRGLFRFTPFAPFTMGFCRIVAAKSKSL